MSVKINPPEPHRTKKWSSPAELSEIFPVFKQKQAAELTVGEQSTHLEEGHLECSTGIRSTKVWCQNVQLPPPLLWDLRPSFCGWVLGCDSKGLLWHRGNAQFRGNHVQNRTTINTPSQWYEAAVRSQQPGALQSPRGPTSTKGELDRNLIPRYHLHGTNHPMQII